MILSTTDLCHYLNSSQPVASKFKAEVLTHVNKKTSKITLADLCNYENISISEGRELCGLNKQIKN